MDTDDTVCVVHRKWDGLQMGIIEDCTNELWVSIIKHSGGVWWMG